MNEALAVHSVRKFVLKCAKARRGEFRGGYLQKSTEEIVPAPVFVFNGVERRQPDHPEVLRQDRIRFGDAQLDDRRQSHGDAVRLESPNLTVIGASCQRPFPRLTQR